MRAWFLKNAFTTEDAFTEFEQLLLPKQSSPLGRGKICQQWKEDIEYEDDDDEFVSPFPMAQPSSGNHWTLQDLTNVLESSESSESSSDYERSLAAVSLSRES